MRRRKTKSPPLEWGQVLNYHDLRETARATALIKAVKPIARRFGAPTERMVDAPAPFSRTVRWAGDLGGDLVKQHYASFGRDYELLGADYDTTSYLPAPTDAETVERGRRNRARRIRLEIGARTLDADLVRLENAFSELLKEMESEFYTHWLHREHIARVRFPVVDLSTVAFRNRGDISIENALGAGGPASPAIGTPGSTPGSTAVSGPSQHDTTNPEFEEEK